ncbi:MAG: hypothetical protein ACT4PP_15380 [Sporichthyaceae bacterium]
MAALLIPGNVIAALDLAEGDEDTTPAAAPAPQPPPGPQSTGLTDAGAQCRSVGAFPADRDVGNPNDDLLLPAHCADPAAVYIVYDRIEEFIAQCPPGDYTEYATYATSGDAPPFAECLGYNMRAGECFTDSERGAVRIGCAAAPAEPNSFRVVAVSKGTRAAVCEKQRAVARVYSQPGRVMCLRALSRGDR